MPLYTFHCERDGVFELLLPITDYDRKTAECPKCGTASHRVAELCTMRPDTMWAGVMTANAGYVTSSSQHSRVLKQRNLIEVGDRADREGIHKIAADARRDKKAKFAKETREFLAEQLNGSGLLDSDGYLRPEATVKLSDQRLLEDQPQQEKILVDGGGSE